MLEGKKMKFKTEICPNCGSEKINYASLETSSGTTFIGIGLPEKYYCKNCGYTGSVILKVDRRKIKKMKFKNFNYKKKKVKHRHTRKPEIMKPILTLTVLFFFITAVLLLFPKHDVSIEETKFIPSDFGMMTIEEMPKGTVISIEPELETITYMTTENKKIEEIDNALGLENTVGYIIPLFFLFLVTGFLVLGLSAHWKRIKLFN